MINKIDFICRNYTFYNSLCPYCLSTFWCHNKLTSLHESNYFLVLSNVSRKNYVLILIQDKLNLDGICRISSIKSDQLSSWFLITLASKRYRESAIFYNEPITSCMLYQSLLRNVPSDIGFMNKLGLKLAWFRHKIRFFKFRKLYVPNKENATWCII